MMGVLAREEPLMFLVVHQRVYPRDSFITTVNS